LSHHGFGSIVLSIPSNEGQAHDSIPHSFFLPSPCFHPIGQRAYDNILKSLYLLDYIDFVQLRKNVQKALNRGEIYHKLHRAISYANFGKLRFKTQNEQNIWEECGRLIANCIIYYNTCILSNLMEHMQKNGDSKGAALMKDVSPVAWPHIILQGCFEFKKNEEPIDIGAIIKELDNLKIPEELILAENNTSDDSDR
jgi:hypothetical protein